VQLGSFEGGGVFILRHFIVQRRDDGNFPHTAEVPADDVFPFFKNQIEIAAGKKTSSRSHAIFSPCEGKSVIASAGASGRWIPRTRQPDGSRFGV
jgi:hypothetical protein